MLAQVLFGSMIWKAQICKRVKVFIWIFALEKLNTCCRLQRRMPSVMCRKEVKYCLHLFCLCPFASSCWSIIFETLNLCWVFPRKCLEALYELSFMTFFWDTARILWFNMMVVLLWRRWYERNKRRATLLLMGFRINLDCFLSLWSSPHTNFFNYGLMQIIAYWESFL